MGINRCTDELVQPDVNCKGKTKEEALNFIKFIELNRDCRLKNPKGNLLCASF